MTLADRIEKRIRAIPANNPGVISFVQEDLGGLLSRRLLRRIAEEAADEATASCSSLTPKDKP